MNPLARNTDPETSHEAGAHMIASGKRAEQAQAALKAVHKHPGLTSLELSRVSGLDRYMLARRLPELEDDGLVRKGDARTCTASRRRAHEWLVA